MSEPVEQKNASPARQLENPYQAPLQDSFRPTDSARTPSDFIDVPLRFCGTIDSKDLIRAITKFGLRRDFKVRQRLFIGVLIIALVVLGVVGAERIPQGDWNFIPAATLVLAGLLGARWINQVFFIRILSMLQFAYGEIEGTIDGETFRVCKKNYEYRCSMNELVSCISAADVMVLSFHRVHLMWYMIPFDAFEDPDHARKTTLRLSSEFPVRKPEADTRLLDQDDSNTTFEPSDDALHFGGQLLSEEMRGSRFSKRSRRITLLQWSLTVLSVMAVVAGLALLFEMGADLIIITAILVVAITILRRFNAWRQGRGARLNGGTPLWNAKGWIDTNGYCSVTKLGQTRVAWDFFHSAEVVERIMVFYPEESATVGMMISRNQFEDETVWNEAQRIVRRQFGLDESHSLVPQEQ